MIIQAQGGNVVAFCSSIDVCKKFETTLSRGVNGPVLQ